MTQATPERAREMFRGMTFGIRDPATLPQVGSITDATVSGPEGGIPVRIYRPEATGPLPTLLFFHGGGFVIGDLDTHDDHARLICRDAGTVVVSVDYRLAPEHPFPAGLLDCLEVTRWAADSIGDLGGDPSRLAVGGDSAGGNLAASVALHCRDEGPELAGQVLLYPTVDFRDDADLHPSRAANAEGYFLTEEDMRWFGSHYLPGGVGVHDPRASVLLAEDLSGLPPAVVAVAGYDPLHDEGTAYAEALRAAGVPVVLRRYPALVHGFFGMGTFSPAAAEAVAEVCADAQRLLQAGSRQIS
ncbi:MAG: alpha/beta hydrolase [Actinomycetota bacterium]|nr:alpha/beta hydrolase [Actinomycetota bacterium]